MSTASRTPLTILFGAASFGEPNTPNSSAHTTTVEKGNAIIDVLRRHGHSTVDTSNAYGGGTSEVFIGKLNLEGITVDTKVNPMVSSFTPENIRAAVKSSVAKLGKINVLYLHAPDRDQPAEDVHRTIDELHKEGAFLEFGLSNFSAWEVAEYVERARVKSWVRPTVYQGSYNAADRAVENELIPALHANGIRFYAYSPLAGGFLSGHLLHSEPKEGSTFHPSSPWSGFYGSKYGPLKPYLEAIQAVAAKHNISLKEVAYRWLQHHSILRPGDGVILGARDPEQLEDALTLSENGPLPEDIVKTIDEVYPKYAKFGKYWVGISKGKVV